MKVTRHAKCVRVVEAGTLSMNSQELLTKNLESFLRDQDQYSRDSYASLLDLIQNTPYSRQLKNIVLRAVHSNFERILVQIRREVQQINPRSAEAQHHLPDLQRLKQLFSRWDGFFYEQPPTAEALVDHVNEFRTLLKETNETLTKLLQSDIRIIRQSTLIYRGLRVLRAAESYLNISNNDASRMRHLAREGTE
jgi:hypothetical protein